MEGYCFCVVYKFIELDEKFKFLCLGQCIVDFGLVLGGWVQVVFKCGVIEVIGIDFLEMDLIEGVVLLQKDFIEDDVLDLVKVEMGGLADLVILDFVLWIIGYKIMDYLCIVGLVEMVVQFVFEMFKFGGSFVVKVFQGGIFGELLDQMKGCFVKVCYFKLLLFCFGSFEIFLIVIGFKGQDYV